jgi:hypothetical protein
VMGKRLERGGTSGLNSMTLGAAARGEREHARGSRSLRWQAVSSADTTSAWHAQGQRTGGTW